MRDGIRLGAALTLLASMACGSGVDRGTEQEAGDEWIQLFNGGDLSDWTAKFSGFELGENPHNTFRVEDGLLKVVYDGYDTWNGEFGHLFYREPFSHYVLRAEYRFVGDQLPGAPGWAFRNNGLMLHSQSPESMGRDQDFPVSIEVQLLGGNGVDPRPTGNLATPGTHVVIDGELVTQHVINSTSPTYHGDQWVTIEVEVYGDSLIRHSVDGVVVLEYSEPQLDDSELAAPLLEDAGTRRLDGGWIAIQAESHPVEFRTIALRRIQ
ncbi:MAG: DUF1080 domain-containing protein [Gemmatimonadales bacterium]|jgi:hypothetical protein